MRWPTLRGSIARWCTCSGLVGFGSGRSPNFAGGIAICRSQRIRITRSVTLVNGVFEIGVAEERQGSHGEPAGIRRRTSCG